MLPGPPIVATGVAAPELPAVALAVHPLAMVPYQVGPFVEVRHSAGPHRSQTFPTILWDVPAMARPIVIPTARNLLLVVLLAWLARGDPFGR